jgi:hypothetical protein
MVKHENTPNGNDGEMPQNHVERVEGPISRVVEQFEENPELFLTESDLKCRMFLELNGDQVFSQIEMTRDGNKKTNYVHSETAYFVLGKLNKRRVDITVVKPSNYDFNLGEVQTRDVVNRKGYSFDEPSIGIELKLNKRKTKTAMEKELKQVLDDLDLLKRTRPESTFYLLFIDKKSGFTPEEIATWQNRYPDMKIFYAFRPLG